MYFLNGRSYFGIGFKQNPTWPVGCLGAKEGEMGILYTASLANFLDLNADGNGEDEFSVVYGAYCRWCDYEKVQPLSYEDALQTLFAWEQVRAKDKDFYGPMYYTKFYIFYEARNGWGVHK